MACDCMAETDPLDPSGPEVVLMHAERCLDHPEHDLSDECIDSGHCPDHRKESRETS